MKKFVLVIFMCYAASEAFTQEQLDAHSFLTGCITVNKEMRDVTQKDLMLFSMICRNLMVDPPTLKAVVPKESSAK